MEISLVTGPQERADAEKIRFRVFVDEQGVPPELELDEHDADADHFLARVDGRPVGTVRMVRRDGTGVLGRLAVLPESRGAGLGAALVRAVERHAREAGLRSVELHAQTSARGFYERLGYEAYGEEDIEVGIPHIWMRKRL
ncbi:acetyltransferase [Actinomadura rubrobrunea]|uniref:Acetyltransferase n=1 Tax=Actinomadura rubrobrunea TaxID=115335 RepID=A0A9W6PUQ5_9ACTN|nr:GNAT family N-acetyltransferase [Actinomadura rubrobrunea]GLW63177.1 acetyltransferase [Actinomadura rubrobrunea]